MAGPSVRNLLDGKPLAVESPSWWPLSQPVTNPSGALPRRMARDRRQARLVAALGFTALQPPPRDAALGALHQLLDSWSGIGLVVAGMERLGFALSLSSLHDVGWRAVFSSDPMLSPAGFAVAPTAWAAVQRAAWAAVKPPAP